MKLMELHAYFANDRSLLHPSDQYYYYYELPQSLDQLLSLDYYLAKFTPFEAFIMDVVYIGLKKVLPYYTLNLDAAAHCHITYGNTPLKLEHQLNSYCSVKTILNTSYLEFCPVEFKVLSFYNVDHGWISPRYKNNIPAPYKVSKLSLDTSVSKLLTSRHINISSKDTFVVAILQRIEGGGMRRFLNLDEVTRTVYKIFNRERVELWYVNSHTSPVDQVQFFKRFDVLISPHSSQLANLMFARPGSHVIEIQHEGVDNVTFQRLGTRVGLKYQLLHNNRSLSVKQAGARDHWSFWDMNVDLAMLEKALLMAKA